MGVTYNGSLDCFMHTFKHEGIFGIYKGWTPSFMRSARGAVAVAHFLFVKKSPFAVYFV